MSLNSPNSLLVAALVMLQRPCSRNHAVASLLLRRAAEHRQLTVAEREACSALADELDDTSPAEPRRPTPRTALPRTAPLPISLRGQEIAA